MRSSWVMGKAKKSTWCNALFILLTFSSLTVSAQVRTGADNTSFYVPLLKGQRVALVANQTSLIGNTHLLDTLLCMGVKVSKVFTLEHGFRGAADAGEKVESSYDSKTGVKLVSLYGKDKKPRPEEMQDIDWVVFDVQDVGVRFYTYISSLHYLMESVAEQKKKIMVLDRPNPNGHYVDGPVLDPRFSSFVGMHPVPIVHGLTIGEYAKMINGEGWLPKKMKADLLVVPCTRYTHSVKYKLPVKPSPNLPNMQAVYLYPSLCLFEGTTVSVGRGTDFPFQVFGAPDLEGFDFVFTPESREGAKYPPHKDKVCYGVDLRTFDLRYLDRLNIDWLIGAYEACTNKGAFFNEFFYRLCGTDALKHQVISGITQDIIRATWQTGLEDFKAKRKKYLLYPDFE